MRWPGHTGVPGVAPERVSAPTGARRPTSVAQRRDARRYRTENDRRRSTPTRRPSPTTATTNHRSPSVSPSRAARLPLLVFGAPMQQSLQYGSVGDDTEAIFALAVAVQHLRPFALR